MYEVETRVSEGKRTHSALFKQDAYNSYYRESDRHREKRYKRLSKQGKHLQQILNEQYSDISVQNALAILTELDKLNFSLDAWGKYKSSGLYAYEIGRWVPLLTHDEYMYANSVKCSVHLKDIRFELHYDSHTCLWQVYDLSCYAKKVGHAIVYKMFLEAVKSVVDERKCA